jgi:GGDEF domain-containing protein
VLTLKQVLIIGLIDEILTRIIKFIRVIIDVEPILFRFYGLSFIIIILTYFVELAADLFVER